MTIGLFFDVDNTLTDGLIQEKFAELLGVRDRYRKIEDDFQSKAITSSDFGRKIIDLFNQAGFTEKFAADSYPKVAKRGWTYDLLHLPVDKYLVSSGPSYYLHPFANEFQIPAHHLLCSEYSFSPDGKLSDCRAVSSQGKANFVQQRRSKHSITVGVGDDLTHDGPFTAACDISILTVQSEGYLHVENLEAVITLVSKISREQIATPRSKPSLFIGCSSERLQPLAVALHAQLDRACEPTIWKDGVFRPSKTYIESLENCLSRFDFAVFIMTPDDVTTMRGVSQPTVRDNIIFELGLFMGRLGRERCFLLHPRDEKPKLPSDIDGIVLVDYPADRSDSNMDAALTAAAGRIKLCIEQLGCRAFSL